MNEFLPVLFESVLGFCLVMAAFLNLEIWKVKGSQSEVREDVESPAHRRGLQRLLRTARLSLLCVAALAAAGLVLILTRGS